MEEYMHEIGDTISLRNFLDKIGRGGTGIVYKSRKLFYGKIL